VLSLRVPAGTAPCPYTTLFRSFGGNADSALEHYRNIAVSTDLPFFPYQLGDHSIPGDTIYFVEKLLKIPNVAGMKLTTNQLLDRSEEHTSELQSRENLVCRLLH